MKHTSNQRGTGEAITLHTGDLHGSAVLITGAAGAARCLGVFAARAAASFVQRYEAEGDSRLVTPCQRAEIVGIYHAASAAAFTSCGILPASRAVLYGYGCAARPSGVSAVECCRVGARGLLPFVALLAWRRALRGAANAARSFLCGRSGGGLISGSPRSGCVILSGVVNDFALGEDEHLAGAEDEQGNLGVLPSGEDGRGLGDGGHVTRGAGLWARGNADASGDAWARQLAHAGECLRAYWLCGSKTGGHGASLRWRDGLADDEARLSALVDTLRGEGLAAWQDVGLALGDGSRVAGATGEAVRRLRKRLGRGDQLLTEHPQRVADAMRGAGFVQEDATTLPMPAARGWRCSCAVCAALPARARIVADAPALPALAAFLADGTRQRAELARVPRRDVQGDAPQARRWWQLLTTGERARVCALLGEALPASAPVAKVRGPWDALRGFPVATAVVSVATVESHTLPAAGGRRMVHAAGRAVALAARKLAIARALLVRAADAAAARSERCCKAAAAVARLFARWQSAPASKAARAARSYWGARTQAAKARKSALAVCPLVAALRARRDVCAARLLAAETRAADACAAAAKAAKLRKVRGAALVAAAKAASVARRAAAADAGWRDLAARLLALPAHADGAADGSALPTGQPCALRGTLARQWQARHSAPLLLTFPARRARALALSASLN